MDPQQPTQQLPASPPSLPQSHSKLSLLLVGLFLSILILGGSYFVFGTKKTEVASPVSQPSPTSIPTTYLVENWETLSLKKLNFKIPQSWWFEQGKNQWYPIEWIDLNATPLPEPRTWVPIFTVRVDTEDKTIQEKKVEVVNTWHLINVTEEKIEVSGIEGIRFEGIVDPTQNNANSRFATNAKVSIALFLLDKDIYQLLGDTTKTENEKTFTQILFTFQFLDQSQTQPTTVLDETLNWETYTVKDKFTFKYPQNLYPQETDKDFIALLTDPNNLQSTTLSIDARLNVDYDQAIVDTKNNLKEVVEKNITGGVEISGEIGPGFGENTPVTFAILKFNQAAIILSYSGNPQDISVFNQILSTFKFLE